ncbi:DUF443 family protein [Salipaludibacillus agaradhaerens]|nr:DUF443 family protein [Salipaludibacillus agaradhaerens]MCR6117749.1 DUF443 family protein [Salipaludibacillus agaradhaerens]
MLSGKGYSLIAFVLFPQTSFRFKDEKVLSDLEIANNEGSGKVNTLSGIGVGLSFFLSSIMDYLNIPTTRLLNGTILLFGLTVILFLHFYCNRLNKENLAQILDIKQLITEKLVIRPKSISHFVIYTFLYTVIVAFLYCFLRDLLKVAISYCCYVVCLSFI